MFSYRHGFHAGNHADILKHLTIMCIARYLTQKEKPFFYMDTHAGAGLYNLESDWAVQTGEARDGIVTLLTAAQNSAPQNIASLSCATLSCVTMPAEVADYVALCRQLYNSGKLYPGSPEIVRSCLREKDVMFLSELHPTEIENLRAYASDDHRLHVQYRDGFDTLKSLLPPRPPLPVRGFVLTDPGYEDGDEYTRTANAICAAAQKWQTGTFAVWYPLIARRIDDVTQLKEQLLSVNCETLCAELCVRSPETVVEDGHIKNLYGSGMIVLRPTWHLDTQLESALSWICNALNLATDSSTAPTYRVTLYPR